MQATRYTVMDLGGREAKDHNLTLCKYFSKSARQQFSLLFSLLADGL